MSSWSCMGPRHRTNSSTSNPTSEEDANHCQSVDPRRPLASKTKDMETEVIASELGMKWSSEMECSPSSTSSKHCQGIENIDDEGGSDGEDLVGHGRIEDRMTEVELWQQLEQELNQPREEAEAIDDDDEMVKEVREEEEEEIAAAAEVANNVSTTTETRRFFPPGKIMHIVPIHPEETSDGEEENRDDADGNGATPKVPRVRIFMTPRSLYGKLRLSRTMINDHYMPMYKRNIDLAISELEKERQSLEGGHL